MSTPLQQIEFLSADGQSTNLGKYSGKVLLIVNVASKCGLTAQYEGLEKTFEKYREPGLMVLGFPANEFAGQEPGTNEEIQNFCTSNFGVKFPVFQKIVVKGEGQHELYKNLTSAQPTATKKVDSGLEKKLSEKGLLSGKPNDITWNFEKFLVNRKGQVVHRFAPDITPEDPVLVKAIELELAQ